MSDEPSVTTRKEWVVQSERGDGNWRDCIGFGSTDNEHDQRENVRMYYEDKGMKSRPFRIIRRTTTITETVVPPARGAGAERGEPSCP